MKLIYLLGACALTLSLVSCNDQPKENTSSTTIQVEVPEKVVVEEKKGTSIKFNSDGGSVKTDKVEIEVNE